MFVTTYIKMMRVQKNKDRVVRYIAYFDYEGNEDFFSGNNK